jgi:hypothetical protein
LKKKFMKKFLLIAVLTSLLLLAVTLASTAEWAFSNGFPDYELSEPASLLLLGAVLFSFSLYWKKLTLKQEE